MFGSDDCAPQMVHSFGTARFLDRRTHGSLARRRLLNSHSNQPTVNHVHPSVCFNQISGRTVLRAICEINNEWR